MCIFRWFVRVKVSYVCAKEQHIANSYRKKPQSLKVISEAFWCERKTRFEPATLSLEG